MKPTAMRLVAVSAIVAVASLGGVAVVAPPAQAASIGVGYNYDSNSHLGSYVVGGVYGYCIDPGAAPPLSASGDAGIVTGYTSHGPGISQNATGLDATTLGRINYLVTTYGQTGDRNQAAAVAMAVATTANPAAYAAHTAPWGDQYYVNYMSAGNWNIVKSLAAQLRAEAAAFTPSSGNGAASMLFQVDNNNYKGTLTMTAMSQSGVPGTITLTNGVFANGTATLSGTFSTGQVIPVTGVPPAGNAHYEISAHADFTGTGGPAGNVHLWTTGGRQGLATPGSAAPASFSADAHDPFDRSTGFAPVVTTQATSVLVKKGSFPQDTVTFATTNFTDGGQTVNNPWALFGDGTYYPVTGKGTWYGPSSAPLVQSAAVPASMPVAGHSIVTTSNESGPTVPYVATSDTAVLEAGYYTWVWSIDYADQTALTQRRLPDGYSFADQFGQAAEGQVSPSQVAFGTELSSATATVCNTVTDTITPTLTGGAWLLSSGGTRIPVTLTGDIYWEDTKPVQAAVAPAGATHLGTVTEILDSPAAITSKPFSVGCKVGFTTLQWSIKQSAQPAQYQGFFTAFSDGYGVQAETVQVLGPTIITKALLTGPGGAVQDVASITGPVPTAGIDLSWAGYFRPADSPVAVCTPATLHFTSTAPVVASAAGDYPSEKFQTPDGFLGNIDWIETATLHGGGEPPVVLHRGVCGADGETSISALPTAVTTAPANDAAGATVHDILTVNGWIPEGTTAVVRLYKQAAGAASLVCGDPTVTGAVLGPIAITAGIATDTKYTSPETAVLKPGQYGFVEQLLDSSGRVLHQGGCQDELFTVTTLPFTGVSGGTVWWFGGATGALLAGAVIYLITRRRSTSDASPLETRVKKAIGE